MYANLCIRQLVRDWPFYATSQWTCIWLLFCRVNLGRHALTQHYIRKELWPVSLLLVVVYSQLLQYNTVSFSAAEFVEAWYDLEYTAQFFHERGHEVTSPVYQDRIHTAKSTNLFVIQCPGYLFRFHRIQLICLTPFWEGVAYKEYVAILLFTWWRRSSLRIVSPVWITSTRKVPWLFTSTWGNTAHLWRFIASYWLSPIRAYVVTCSRLLASSITTKCLTSLLRPCTILSISSVSGFFSFLPHFSTFCTVCALCEFQKRCVTDHSISATLKSFKKFILKFFSQKLLHKSSAWFPSAKQIWIHLSSSFHFFSAPALFHFI